MVPLYMVYAPIGGFGNHLRWLMLLNERYVVTLDGETLSTARDKVDFIKRKVYCDNRTWHNWLEYEYKFRPYLNNVIKFTHDVTDMWDGLKTVSLSVDPVLSLRCYWKFNLSLNHISTEIFLKQIRKQNELANYISKKSDDFICLDSNKLFQSHLDAELYQLAVDFFAMDPNYTEAQQIHQLWYELQIKSEREFVADMKAENKLTPEFEQVYINFKGTQSCQK